MRSCSISSFGFNTIFDSKYLRSVWWFNDCRTNRVGLFNVGSRFMIRPEGLAAEHRESLRRGESRGALNRLDIWWQITANCQRLSDFGTFENQTRKKEYVGVRWIEIQFDSHMFVIFVSVMFLLTFSHPEPFPTRPFNFGARSLVGRLGPAAFCSSGGPSFRAPERMGPGGGGRGQCGIRRAGSARR